MAPKKDFDCVEMKNRIQAELEELYRGLTPAERNARMLEELENSDDPISRWWRELRAQKPASGKQSDAA